MEKYKEMLKIYLREWINRKRGSLRISQEKMADRLRMNVRSYSDLERGKYGASGTTVLLFIAQLEPEEVLSFHRNIRKEIAKAETAVETDRVA